MVGRTPIGLPSYAVKAQAQKITQKLVASPRFFQLFSKQRRTVCHVDANRKLGEHAIFDPRISMLFN
jgi:hypothetical protein